MGSDKGQKNSEIYDTGSGGVCKIKLEDLRYFETYDGESCWLNSDAT